MLGSVNTNLYEDLKSHLENIHHAANIFQYISYDERRTQNAQETITRLKNLEVVQMKEAESRSLEQQQRRAEQLEHTAYVKELYSHFKQQFRIEIKQQLGIEIKKLLESNAHAELCEPSLKYRYREADADGN